MSDWATEARSALLAETRRQECPTRSLSLLSWTTSCAIKALGKTPVQQDTLYCDRQRLGTETLARAGLRE